MLFNNSVFNLQGLALPLELCCKEPASMKSSSFTPMWFPGLHPDSYGLPDTEELPSQLWSPLLSHFFWSFQTGRYHLNGSCHSFPSPSFSAPPVSNQWTPRVSIVSLEQGMKRGGECTDKCRDGDSPSSVSPTKPSLLWAFGLRSQKKVARCSVLNFLLKKTY